MYKYIFDVNQGRNYLCPWYFYRFSYLYKYM